MRELYAERLAVLRESIEQRLAGILDVPRVEAGVHIPVWLNNGLAAENLAYISTAHDLELWPISRFVLKNPRPEGLLLGFAAVDNREIRRGVDCLATVVESCRRKRNYRTTGL
jgi:GntR family transcriptional regulator/MocR family aminotransferase